MKFTKYIPLGLMIFSGLVFSNLNAKNTEKAVELVDKVIDAEKHFKNQWFAYKKDHDEKCIDLMQKHHDEMFDHAKKAATSLIEDGTEKLDELMLNKVDLFEKQAKECKELHEALMSKAKKIYDEQMSSASEFKKELEKKHNKIEKNEKEDTSLLESEEEENTCPSCNNPHNSSHIDEEEEGD